MSADLPDDIEQRDSGCDGQSFAEPGSSAITMKRLTSLALAFLLLVTLAMVFSFVHFLYRRRIFLRL